MRFEIERDVLTRALQSIIGVVERRQTLPILANVLLRANEDGLSLTTTDLEVELEATMKQAVETSGETTLPARKLMDIARNLPEDSTIQVEVDGEKAVVRSGRSRFSLVCLAAEDFPTVNGIGDTTRVELSQNQLRELIEKTHFCMASQDVRYYLNGLLIELESGRLRAVATDGHRLALAELTADITLDEPKAVILPRKGVQELMRLVERSDDPVTIELAGSHLRVVVSGIVFTSKLIDGQFPAYERVIPATDGGRLAIGREDLRQALVRVSILSNEKYRGVRMVVDESGLRVQSNNPEHEEAEEELSAEYHGAAVEIGFNANYMLEALAAIDEPAVSVFLTDASSSALVKGEGAEDSRYVVMPMRL